MHGDAILPAATRASANSNGGGDRVRVLLVCCGLDHARRGYESFARECFEALRDEAAIELHLVKASGDPGRREHVAPTLRRDRAVAQGAGRLFGFRPFRAEALAFAGGLQPLLIRTRPDLVYVSEWDTARGLAALRPVLRQRFRLLLCNGGFAETGFDHLDHVQQLTPAALEHVVALGADPRRHSMLPLGFVLPAEPPLLSADDRAALRRRLDLPVQRPVLLSVAALNRGHKRLHYVIDEVAALPAPRPFLLLAGEPDAETPGLRRQADAQLGADGYSMRTVPSDQVGDLYRAADAFVLASLHEMQGRALIEAGGYGLPCLAHDSPIMRFALGDSGSYTDLSQAGALTQLLSDQLGPRDSVRGAETHRHVFERFSWERLRPRYVELLRSVALANSTVSSSTGEKLPR